MCDPHITNALKNSSPLCYCIVTAHISLNASRQNPQLPIYLLIESYLFWRPCILAMLNIWKKNISQNQIHNLKTIIKTRSCVFLCNNNVMQKKWWFIMGHIVHHAGEAIIKSLMKHGNFSNVLSNNIRPKKLHMCFRSHGPTKPSL